MSGLEQPGGNMPATSTPPPVNEAAKRWIVASVLLGLLLGALDQTVVGTALPRIVTDLGGNSLYTWAFTAYLLTATISGPIYGKLSDLLGRRPVLLAAIGLFLAGSAFAGVSANMGQLIVFRGVQGLGAGAFFPMALIVIGDLFSPADRGKFQGLVGGVWAVASLVGPALGGILTDTVGWRWAFFLNLPLGALILAVIWRMLPKVRPIGTARPSIDYLGTTVFIAALLPILIGLTNKQSADWGDVSVGGLIVIGAAMLLLFAWIERRAPEPLVPLDLFRTRTFVVAVSAAFLISSAFFAAVVFLPRWFQVVAGVSAASSGYQILPLVGAVSLSAIAAGQIVARTGRYKALLLAAPIAMAFGLVPLIGISPDFPRPLLWASMFVVGLGVGPPLAVLILVVQGAVSVRQLGAATSNVTLFQQIGGTVGLAIAGTVFGTRLIEETPRQLSGAGLPVDVLAEVERATGGSVLGDLAGVGDLASALLGHVSGDARARLEPFLPDIVDAIHRAFSIATGSTFAIGVGAVLLATALIGLLREMPLRSWDTRETTADLSSQRGVRNQPAAEVRL
jgi:EmrB/QacA subfamily drug resistance transporter